MRTVALVAHQVRYDQRAFWRDRQAVFGILALPLIFLVILVALFGNDDSGDFHVKNSTYYVPAIIALSVVSATFQYLAISLVERREAGIPSGCAARRSRPSSTSWDAPRPPCSSRSG